jgi:hypothetical protein
MELNAPDLAKPLETWLLHRVAEAVEGNEVSATPLTDLHAAMVCRLTTYANMPPTS